METCVLRGCNPSCTIYALAFLCLTCSCEIFDPLIIGYHELQSYEEVKTFRVAGHHGTGAICSLVVLILSHFLIERSLLPNQEPFKCVSWTTYSDGLVEQCIFVCFRPIPTWILDIIYASTLPCDKVDHRAHWLLCIINSIFDWHKKAVSLISYGIHFCPCPLHLVTCELSNQHCCFCACFTKSYHGHFIIIWYSH